MSEEIYSGPDRRQEGRRADVDMDALTSLMTRVVTLVERYMETHTNVMEAFVDKDAVAHRRAHEVWIAESQQRAAFWLDMRNSMAKWGLIGLAGWIFMQLWTGALKGPSP